ncbi:ABC transporter permease [Nocardia mangyaensis]|uniref:ABC transporter permease n=1 Tax=Nocardia mangyaensis TaxID=2213200 RepID=A0A1J0VQT1_9NOCA|nr:carbohydrate ABC transporter permease [Nocardia mangyaensis]APE34370.1 ABC transporter permease [Nocardia mangyaensis]
MRRGDAIGRHALVITAIVAMLFPVVLALATSFKPVTTIFDLNPIPVPASLENYDLALGRFPIGRLLFNTFVMAIGVTVTTILVALPGAYALVRFDRARGRGLVLVAVGASLLIPPQALIIPQFLMTTRLGWQGHTIGVIIPQLGVSALALLLLRDHIRAIPQSLIGAAVLEGATSWEILRHVVLGLLRPALGAVAILLFISTWNEFLWPLLVMPDPEDTTIQPGLALFLGPESSQYGPMLAASMLASLPVVAIYVLASRRIADAFLHSGVR